MDFLTAILEDDVTGLPSKRIAEASVDSGSGKGFYSDRHIQALLTLVQTKSYGRVLAHPKILVDDNKPGSIDTSDTTYVTRTHSSSSTGDNPVLQETTEDIPYTAGITLTITPHISKGNNLRLEIDLVRSDFGTITGTKPPDKATNTIGTTVTVPDNATIILGGMERLNQSKSGSRVPILSDIPIIGGLFKNIDNSDIQKKLYIFVKAHILRPTKDKAKELDVVRISRKNRAEFEKMEAEMQKYENWPGIKSKPMDPERILEADDNIESMDSLQFLEEAKQSKTTGRQQYTDADVQELL